MFFKREMSMANVARTLTEISVFCEMVAITNELHVITADSKDDKVIECALAGKATHIVTGDRRHLLPLREYKGIIILNPADFLAQFKEEG